MCTAIYQQSEQKEFAVRWKVKARFSEEAIRPSQPMNAVVRHDNQWIGGMLGWGIQAPWTGKKKLLLHARIESISGGSFWSGWKPCVVPIDSFVERNTKTDNPKHMIFSGESLWLGALWKRDDGNIAKIVLATTSPIPSVALVHHRMPVCLQPSDLEAWVVGFQRSKTVFNLKATPMVP
jgi:putative SOS response-associated peptidase YedK